MGLKRSATVADNKRKRGSLRIGPRGTEINVAAIRDCLEDALNCLDGGERIILLRRGKPVAAIVPIDELAVLERIEDEADIRAAREARKEKGGITLAEYRKKHGI